MYPSVWKKRDFFIQALGCIHFFTSVSNPFTWGAHFEDPFLPLKKILTLITSNEELDACKRIKPVK